MYPHCVVASNITRIVFKKSRLKRDLKNNLPKGTQLESGSPRIQTQASLILEPTLLTMTLYVSGWAL